MRNFCLLMNDSNVQALLCSAVNTSLRDERIVGPNSFEQYTVQNIMSHCVLISLTINSRLPCLIISFREPSLVNKIDNKHCSHCWNMAPPLFDNADLQKSS